MEVYVARTSGPCRGVRRAVRMVEQYVASHGPGSVAVLGNLVEWPSVWPVLQKYGVRRVEHLDEVAEGQALALPVGGVSARVQEQLDAWGGTVLPTVCDYRARAQNLAYRMARDGYPVLVLGPAEDPEVTNLLDWVEKGWREALARLAARADRVFAGCAISAEKESLEVVSEDVRHVAFISRCLERESVLSAAASLVVGRFAEVRFFNTICPSVLARSREARRLGERCDLVLVVGRQGDPLARLLVEEAQEAGARAMVLSGPGMEERPWQEETRVGLVSTCEVPQELFVAVGEGLRRQSASGEVRAVF